MRRIAAVTVARSDYGHLAPVLDAVDAIPELELELVVAGMHLDPALGLTIQEIERDGRRIAAQVPVTNGDDSPLGISRAIGRGIVGFAEAFSELRPDVVLVLGDRFEMHAAAVAALPLGIAVAHVHGGESSEGAFDESFRHAITKLSHLHFAATEVYGRRIVQMGEEPWRVVVTGAPGLDAIARLDPLPREELDRLTGLALDEPTLLVTYHPETLSIESADSDLEELLVGVEASRFQLLFTAPNADTYGRRILARIEEFVAGRRGTTLVPSLGSRAYLSALQRVVAMVGNSSSGIIEAPSFGLPVVNVGERQGGRVRGANVIDVPAERERIAASIERATSSEFRLSLAGMANPYGDGEASARIVAKLSDVPLGRDLLVKRFHELA